MKYGREKWRRIRCCRDATGQVAIKILGEFCHIPLNEERLPRVNGNSSKAALHLFFDVVLTAEPILNELRNQYGLSLAQIRCLFQLRQGPQTAGEMARSLGIRATSLTRMIERLDSEKWVERKNDVHDRRRVVITLMPEAEAMLSQLGFFLDSDAASAIKRFTPEERADFIRILTRYLECVAEEKRAADHL